MDYVKKILMIEKNLEYLLQSGVPSEIIEESEEIKPFLKYKFCIDLLNGYKKKENEMMRTYSEDRYPSMFKMADSYNEVYHPVGGERQHYNHDDQMKLFKLRDEYRKPLDEYRQKELKKMENELSHLSEKISNFKSENPCVEKIDEFLKSIKEEKNYSLDGVVEEETANNQFLKKNLFPDHIEHYKKVYAEYRVLVDKYQEMKEIYEDNQKGYNYSIFKDSSYVENFRKVKELEEELIVTNTRLVQAFIRRKYSTLLVEQSLLFSICYSGLAKAIREFDYTQGNAISTAAWKYMDIEVKNSSNFKQLTGYSWSDFWNKRKVELFYESMGELIKQGKVTPEDVQALVDSGFLGMTSKRVGIYSDMVSEYSFSELCDMVEDYNNEYYKEYESESSRYQNFSNEYGNIENKGKIFGEDDIFKILDNQALKDKLLEIFDDVLNDKEKLIIKESFGIDGVEPKTSKEIGEMLGVSATRINQIRYRALLKLKSTRTFKRYRQMEELKELKF